MGPSSIVEHIGMPDEKKTIIPASYSFLKLDFDGIIRKLNLHNFATTTTTKRDISSLNLTFFLCAYYLLAPGASVTGEDVLIGKVVEINKTAETHK